MSTGDRDDTAALHGAQPDAVGHLFLEHGNAVYGHCLRRTGDWAAAEDLTSLVFLQAWRRRQELTVVDGSVLPWLLATANMLLRNHARSLRRHRALVERLAPDSDLADPADEVASRIDDQRAAARVRERLADLPSRERDVFELVALAGLTYEQAAAALSVPVGTVRSRLSRARTRLQAAGPNPFRPMARSGEGPRGDVTVLPEPTVAPLCPEETR